MFDEIGFSWLDMKLGVRMLGKYPGLSLVSAIGMSVAIAIGASGFGFIHAVMDAPLPLDEGDRVVSLQYADARTPGSPARPSPHDFLRWREEVGSVRDLSAFIVDDHTLSIPGGDVAFVRVARTTASAFRVARVAPVLGRPLLDEDERPGAPPVVVIGYEEWRRRFGGDPAIIGRPVRLDAAVHAVVGVMPEGFHFPINHSYWVPLRLDPAAHRLAGAAGGGVAGRPGGDPGGGGDRGAGRGPGVGVGAGGPEVFVFGRLADGVTLEQAQAELATIGQRMAATNPETHEHLRPRILPYTHPFIGIDTPATALALRLSQFALGLLLVLVAVNVAVLVYARTAARTGEIAVRSALGASRRRVVTQLFAEALVLSLLAALVGLGITSVVFARAEDFLARAIDQALPFWVELGLSPSLVAYVAGLAILAAVIVGVLPALKATGRGLQGALQQLSSRAYHMQLGRTWTALIVVQVAVAVAMLPTALYVAGQALRRGAADPAYPVDEFLRAFISLDRDGALAHPDAAAGEEATSARFVLSASELIRRLEAEPTVSGVAFATSFPGSERVVRIDVEGAGTQRWAWVNQVDPHLFAVFDVPVLAGRGFVEADVAPGSNAIVVDRAFVERVLGGGPVLGRRVRLVGGGHATPGEERAGTWLEVVGVVPEFAVPPGLEASPAPKMYRPLALAEVPAGLALAIRMKPGAAPAPLLVRLPEITASVDPALRLDELQTAADAERERQQGLLFMALAVAAVTGSVLLLSAAGIYAMMSFTVARRRREIGIRAALGAAPRRLLASIFARAGAQLATGMAAGLGLGVLVVQATGGRALSGEGVLYMALVAALMTTIGLLAALVPAREALAVQPTEALKEE